MSVNSSIEWTEATWNPVTGCTKISPGCVNCYAERMAKRLKAMGQYNYRNEFKLTEHENSLQIPLTWKSPKTVFVNSMSDLFHEKVSTDFILKVFDIMNKACWHTYQVLTKRSDRLSQLNSLLPWNENIWMGVSVENDEYLYRIDHLRYTNADIKFISFEPLLGPMGDINLSNVDWVIIGGESGPGARPMKKEWVEEIREQCLYSQVPFFFKQWGGFNKKKYGRKLNGRTWDETPNIYANYSLIS